MLALITLRRIGVPRRAVAAPIVLALALLSATPVLAHDPGQGEELGTVPLVAYVDTSGTAADLRLIAGCDQFQPQRVTARR